MSQERTPILPYAIAFVVLCWFMVTQVWTHEPNRSLAQADTKPVTDKNPEPTVARQPNLPVKAHATRVVLIGVDGLHVALVKEMPNVQKLFADGTGTYLAQVPLRATTAISFGALFTGADPDVSGVNCEPDECPGSRYEKKDHVHAPTFRWKPLRVRDTLFTAVEASGRSFKAVVQKGKLVGLIRPNGDETDISVAGSAQAVKIACKAASDPNTGLVFVHFAMIDDRGHHFGWLSEQQKTEARTIDGQIGQIRACLDADTALIVTADHGGPPGKINHGANDDDNRLVPWVAVGPGIKKGHVLSKRGDLSLTTNGTQPAILLFDTVPTILRLLGLPETSLPALSKHAKPVDQMFL